eukprot:TRINITY_DN745_c0_g1_i2.p1 TRINITY_DN745_c0_g1~~TRINITY_DN745_c0_g1_i2.p1  ORF type:complete len:1060 (+),score=235.51 TRINITY_DN745_c0_g1_i2:76-3255(+)
MIENQTQKEPLFGELFVTNDELSGGFEQLKHFRGKLLTTTCGGYKKLFVIEEGQNSEGIVSTLHAPEYDDYEYTYTDEPRTIKSFEEIFAYFNNKGQIKNIICGKKHTIILTIDGLVYSYGVGEYGALGHGGATFCEIPRQIIKLSNKKIIQIACGEFHTMVLTSDKDIYAWGRGFEGQLGLKLQQTASAPQFLGFFYKKFECDSKNYSIKKEVKIVIKQIACGAYHSMAITDEGQLYVWGENKLGQCGINGNPLNIFTPTLLHVRDNFNQQQFIQFKLEEKVKRQAAQKKEKINIEGSQVRNPVNVPKNQEPEKQAQQENEKKVENPTNNLNEDDSQAKKEQQPTTIEQHQNKEQPIVEENKEPTQLVKKQPQVKEQIVDKEDDKLPSVKIVSASGGYGHTVVISDNGEIYVWGLNIKGQLGVGDSISRYLPVKLVKDNVENQLPVFKIAKCGYHTTFAIDEKGQVWSWGGGNLGYKNDHAVSRPRRIIENTENRKFTDLMVIANSAAVFSPLRILSVQPNYGPSIGGTLISLIGTGFADTSKQSIRFIYGDKSQYVQEVGLLYDPQTESFSCQTPKFDEEAEVSIQWPQLCKLEVTLDGKIYNACEQNFLIYSSKIQMKSIEPKCASIQGGTELIIYMDIDNVTTQYLKYLTVGFQKRVRKETKKAEKDLVKSTLTEGQLKSQDEETEQNKRSKLASNEEKILNPLDLSVNDPELEKENIICVEGMYQQGKVICKIPKITPDSQNIVDSLNYNIDVSINGQQFTGNPDNFKYYDIQIGQMVPNNSTSQGETKVKISIEGFIETQQKKIVFTTEFGERIIEPQWSKKDKQLSFTAPPVNWLLGGKDPTPELVEKIFKSGADVKMTVNGKEWIDVGKYLYIEPDIQRIGPVVLDNSLNEEEKNAKWQQQEPEIDPLQNIVEEDEIEKKKQEIQAKIDEEKQEMDLYFKKSGQYLYLHGNSFVNMETTVQFIYQNQAVNVKGIFKNPHKVGVVIPEMYHVPPGIQEIIIEVSFNGQQYSKSGKKFRYLAFDKNQTQQERQKAEDEELKKIKQPKKAPGKK